MLKSLRCFYKPLMDRPNSMVKQLAKYLEQSSTAPCVKENLEVSAAVPEPSIEPEAQASPIDLPKEDPPPASDTSQLQEQKEQNLVQEPIQIQEAIQLPEPIQIQEPIQLPEPIQLQEPIKQQEPIQLQEPIKLQEPVQLQEPIQLQGPIQLQENIQLQEDIKLQEHIQLQEQNQLRKHFELPEKYQLINSFHMNIHCHSNIIDKNAAVITPEKEEEIREDRIIVHDYSEVPWRDPIAIRIEIVSRGTGYSINSL